MPKDKSWAQFLKEGVDCDLVFFNDRVISVEPPQSMTLKVTKTQPGVKGDRSAGGTKPATLETGAEIQVRAAVCLCCAVCGHYSAGWRTCQAEPFHRPRSTWQQSQAVAAICRRLLPFCFRHCGGSRSL